MYKDMFGKPNEGIHSRRVFGVAFWDVFMTIVIAMTIAKYYKRNVYKTVGYAFVIGILAHRVYCVRTTIDKLIFHT
jgi:uncharacterized metal-binding protein